MLGTYTLMLFNGQAPTMSSGQPCCFKTKAAALKYYHFIRKTTTPEPAFSLITDPVGWQLLEPRC